MPVLNSKIRKLNDSPTPLMAAFEQWKKAPTPVTTTQVLKAATPIIDKAVYRVAGEKNSILKSKAKKIVIDSLSTFDPNRGTLEAHLTTNLQRLFRYAGSLRQLIKQPERIAIATAQLNSTLMNLTDKLGREPSDAEIADEMGISLKRLESIRSARYAIPESSFQQFSESGFNDINTGQVSLGQNQQDLIDWAETVYLDLNPTDQFILERLVGLHGHKSQSPSQIAKKLKITPAALSYRISKIQKLLDLYGSV